MKRFARLICLVMVFTLLAAIPAHAAETSARASDYFASYRAYVTKLSSTELGVAFHVVCVSRMDEVGVSRIRVQRSSDGTNWTTVHTFNKSAYTNMTDTNTYSHGSTVSCSITPGYYYRAIVDFYAKNSSGSAAHFYYTEKK